MNETAAARQVAPAQSTDNAQGPQILQELFNAQDFPALSQVIAQVNRLISSDDSHADQLTDAILKDMGLTNKLLRLVNSAHFGSFGSQPINTVSRAVVILGYDAVRDAALSLMLFEHMQNHAQAAELKSDSIESFYCGILGRMLARKLGYRDAEEAFICSLFRNLGRLLIRLHFYERSKEVEALMAEQKLGEDVAARKVFGLSYDEIGQAVGKHWHMPNALLEGMAPLPPGNVRAGGNRLQMMANLARDLYATVKDTPQEQWGKVTGEVAQRYKQAAELPAVEMVEIIYTAGEKMEKEAGILQADPRSSPLLRKLLERRHAEPEKATAEEAIAGEIVEEAAPPNDPNAILIDGLQELTGMLLGEYRAADLLNVLAELLYRTGCFDNVLICVLDPASKSLQGRVGHGQEAGRLRSVFRIPLGFTADVFHAAISKGADILITDTRADSIRSRIPDWHVQQVGAKSFLLLPLSINQKTLALIYADKREAGLALSQQTLGLIKSLRNQTVLALRQKSNA